MTDGNVMGIRENGLVDIQLCGMETMKNIYYFFLHTFLCGSVGIRM